MQPSCCRSFSAAKILPNPKLKNKRKFFIQGLSKQYGFASQEFLVVRGNDWGFLWSGRHTRRWKGVGVCQFAYFVPLRYHLSRASSFTQRYGSCDGLT